MEGCKPSICPHKEGKYFPAAKLKGARRLAVALMRVLDGAPQVSRKLLRQSSIGPDKRRSVYISFCQSNGRMPVGFKRASGPKGTQLCLCRPRSELYKADRNSNGESDGNVRLVAAWAATRAAAGEMAANGVAVDWQLSMHLIRLQLFKTLACRLAERKRQNKQPAQTSKRLSECQELTNS